MSKQIIRIGDPTSHGGKVESTGAPQFTVEGRAVALKGDPCSCPHRGHSGVTIAEGDPNHTINGVPVAYEGHKTSCGATLQASVGNFSKG
ncbi:MAG TPA: PAAR domain-containing protein [Burkholderiaceae bacterium]